MCLQKRRDLRAVGVPAARDVQHGVAQRPCPGQQVAEQRLSTTKGMSVRWAWGSGGRGAEEKDAGSW